MIFIHSSSEVHESALIGENTKVWNFSQIRENTEIGKNCIIGKDVYIDENVKIGDSCKIQNGVSIFNGVSLENEVFIGPNACFTNDMFPRATSQNWKIVETRICHGASIGANSTIICGITVANYSMIGAGTVLTKNTIPYGLYIGNPGRLIGLVCKAGHKIASFTNNSDIQESYYCETCKSKIHFFGKQDEI